MREGTAAKAQHLTQDLITRAWENESFKKELINNPETTIEKVVGHEMTIPEGSKIVVEDQSDQNYIYINIPRNVTVEELELTDEQLEAVSGGDLGATAAVVTLIVAGAQVLDWIGEGWNSYP